MLIFDQQVSSTKRNTTNTNALHAYSLQPSLLGAVALYTAKTKKKKKTHRRCTVGVVDGEMHAFGQVGE